MLGEGNKTMTTEEQKANPRGIGTLSFMKTEDRRELAETLQKAINSLNAAEVTQSKQVMYTDGTPSREIEGYPVMQTSQPVAWQSVWPDGFLHSTWTTKEDAVRSVVQRGGNSFVRPLYAAPVADKAAALLAALKNLRPWFPNNMFAAKAEEAIKKHEAGQ